MCSMPRARCRSPPRCSPKTRRDAFVAGEPRETAEAPRQLPRRPEKGNVSRSPRPAPQARHTDWADYTPPVPSFTGTRDDQEARRCASSPSTSTGRRSSTPGNSAACGTARTTLLKTKNAEGAAEAAQTLSGRARLGWTASSPRTASAREGIYGFFPANADGDDIMVWTDESRTTERTRLPHACASRSRRTPASRTSRCATGSRRTVPARITSAASSSASTARTNSRRNWTPPRSLRRDHGQGPRRPLRRSLRRTAPPPRPRRVGLRTAEDEFDANEADPRELYRGIRPRPAIPPSRTTPKSRSCSTC